jgi:uncharacterized alpha-E superfamily protein
MLSRVADALFWMSRYVERADQVARWLDVTFHLELDLHGVMSEPSEWEWSTLLTTLQQPPLPPTPEPMNLVSRVSRWLTVDRENAGSVMSCINRSRNNARSIRGSLSPGMWRELNKLYWQLSDPELRERVAESPHDFCEAAQVGAQLFHGICDATLTHDEGWHFIQLGKHLERAEKMLRLLDAKYQTLAHADPTNILLANVQWGAVLKSCQAFEAYQRLYISRVEPEQVIEFLLLNPEFPSSVRYCIATVTASLEAISGTHVDRGQHAALRTAGRLLSELTYRDMSEVLDRGLHEFLRDCLAQCQRMSETVHDQYALH